MSIWDISSQNPSEMEDALNEHIDNQRKQSYGEDEFSNESEATPSFRQEAPKPTAAAPKVAPTIQPTSTPVSSRAGKEFSPDEIDHLKRIAGHMHSNQIRQRNHYADPKLNPKNAVEGHIASALHDAHSDYHNAWAEKANSDEYKKATTPQRWRQQLQFKRDWHTSNPDHLNNSTDARLRAKDTAEQINTHYLQNKKAGLETVQTGGQGMTAAQAAAHFGTKGADDETVQVDTVSGVRGDTDKAKQELLKPKYQNLPQEEVEAIKNPNEFQSASLPPDLQTPKSKELMNSMAANYAHIMDPTRMSKLLDKKDNIQMNGLDDGRLRDAATSAMWRALHHFNEYRAANHTGSDLDSFIRASMNNAIRNDAKAQLSSNHVTPREKQSDAKRTEGLKTYSPEEKEALKQKIIQEHQQTAANKEKLAQEQAKAESQPRQPMPSKTKMTPEEMEEMASKLTGMPSDKPKKDWESQLQDDRADKLKQIKAQRGQ